MRELYLCAVRAGADRLVPAAGLYVHEVEGDAKGPVQAAFICHVCWQCCVAPCTPISQSVPSHVFIILDSITPLRCLILCTQDVMWEGASGSKDGPLRARQASEAGRSPRDSRNPSQVSPLLHFFKKYRPQMVSVARRCHADSVLPCRAASSLLCTAPCLTLCAYTANERHQTRSSTAANTPQTNWEQLHPAGQRGPPLLPPLLSLHPPAHPPALHPQRHSGT